MLNVILVNAGNYLGRGEEYVDRLKAAISRNLTLPHVFHVLTEQDAPPDVAGWWTKLEMFRSGRFEGRCIYFDLDTIITGSLDEIASYSGDFAIVRDFNHPNLGQSCLMAWDASKTRHIYAAWHNAGRPQFHAHGDGGWINATMPDADKIQDLYPGQLVSFKLHCGKGVPEGARVVAFHGLPRPHQIHDLMRHW